jgi:hypothetical protein
LINVTTPSPILLKISLVMQCLPISQNLNASGPETSYEGQAHPEYYATKGFIFFKEDETGFCLKKYLKLGLSAESRAPYCHFLYCQIITQSAEMTIGLNLN